MSRCFLCYENLKDDSNYHDSCLKKIFDTNWIPILEMTQNDFPLFAQKMAGQMSISGAQPKITLNFDKKNKKLKAIPQGGNWILKPQTESFAHLPENEDLCMHLAHLYEIEIPKHGLIKTQEGDFAYLIKRFDIVSEMKRLPVEDFGQILEIRSDKKYSSSYENIAKAILKHCTNKYLELLRFFERLIFCFVIGNGDMHLKNFSLVTYPEGTVALSPAYDLLSSKLVIPNEEDLPISLVGKKNKIRGRDFTLFAKTIGLSEKAFLNSIQRLIALQSQFEAWIERSFLTLEAKEKLNKILKERIKRFS